MYSKKKKKSIYTVGFQGSNTASGVLSKAVQTKHRASSQVVVFPRRKHAPSVGSAYSANDK